MQKTKIKFSHNKKRNTAFLFEVLVRELTQSVLVKDNKRKTQIVSLLKEFFNKNTILAKELKLYKALAAVYDCSEKSAEKILQETKKQHENLDFNSIFNNQTKLISSINKQLSPSVFSNFVPS